MSLRDELKTIVENRAANGWNITSTETVPETEDIGLGNVGKKVEAVMLYADLADSTTLALHDRKKAAEVFKAYLACCAKIILSRSGKVRSFDGDRIMGVFIEGAKNTNAVLAGLEISDMFDTLLVPRFKEQYYVFREGTIPLSQCVGIDRSEVLVVRGGVRNNNDLVWVGRAPNVAAKLSALRGIYTTYVTEDVYAFMLDDAKLSPYLKKNMWTTLTWNLAPSGVSRTIYGTSWTHHIN